MKNFLTEGFLTPEYKRFDSTAFIIDAAIGSQESFVLFHAINQQLPKNPYHEMVVFSLSHSLPVLQPRCAIYPGTEMGQYTGTLVFSSPQGLQFARQLGRAAEKKYWYIYDIHAVDSVEPMTILQIERDIDQIIPRTKEHRKVLEKLFSKTKISTFNAEDYDALMEHLGELHGS